MWDVKPPGAELTNMDVTEHEGLDLLRVSVSDRN